MSPDRPTRRRAIAIMAATAAAAAGLPLRARARAGAEAGADYEWRGLAMGTDARILFCGVTGKDARAAAAMVSAEIERLEDALSLFRADSEICRLNRNEVLDAPSGDLRRAVTLARSIAHRTDGLFDPTVQALWEAHANWFAAAPRTALPPEAVIADARARVDWRRISVSPDAIRLGPRQRITLNGLGQGYVTDRIADLLRQRGFVHVLVDLGEQRAIGPRPNGKPWLVERQGAGQIALTRGALATSEGSGCILGAGGKAHHLFDPRTGRSAQIWKRLTVHHSFASVADALSTALYMASPDEIASVAARIPAVAVWATEHNGRERKWIGQPPPVGISPPK